MRHYTPSFEREVRAWAKAHVPAGRWAHVRGVVETAAWLAERYTPREVMRARLAGWIHDVAKAWDDAALLAYAEEHGWALTEAERDAPMLLHGAVSYALAAERFGLDDPSLQSACARHTSGAPQMTTLDKVVFVADLIEPTRDFKGLKAIRRAARHELDVAVLISVDFTLRHLLKRQRPIDPRAVALHNALVRAGVRYNGK